MDFGISRFLEMFEERFGRTATSTLLAVIGIAILAWAMQTTIAFSVYLYKLTLKANLVPQLEAESILAHLIFFGVQLVITFLFLPISGVNLQRCVFALCEAISIQK